MEESWESQEAALSFLSELTHSFSNYLRIQTKSFFFYSFSLSQTHCELYIVRISVNSDCRVVKATESSVVKMVTSNMCCFWSYAISFTCVKLAQQFNNLKVFFYHTQGGLILSLLSLMMNVTVNAYFINSSCGVLTSSVGREDFTNRRISQSRSLPLRMIHVLTSAHPHSVK